MSDESPTLLLEMKPSLLDARIVADILGPVWEELGIDAQEFNSFESEHAIEKIARAITEAYTQSPTLEEPERSKRFSILNHALQQLARYNNRRAKENAPDKTPQQYFEIPESAFQINLESVDEDTGIVTLATFESNGKTYRLDRINDYVGNQRRTTFTINGPDIIQTSDPLSDEPDLTSIIAEYECYQAFTRDDAENIGCPYIHRRCVEKQYRNSGLSKILERLTIEYYKAHGAREIMLSAHGIETICWALAHDFYPDYRAAPPTTTRKLYDIRPPTYDRLFPERSAEKLRETITLLLKGWNNTPHTEEHVGNNIRSEEEDIRLFKKIT